MELVESYKNNAVQEEKEKDQMLGRLKEGTLRSDQA
jgi:hypothetical protein